MLPLAVRRALKGGPAGAAGRLVGYGAHFSNEQILRS